ncbi:MAG: excinuclease ABC subunit UvrC [Minisyncoccia bacterium]
MTNKLYKNLPDTPGVYIFKNTAGKILYIGKAGNLKRRVSSYFLRGHDSRIEKLVNEIKKIEYKKTDTAIEALILEAELIKKYQPPYNVREKDDSSFLFVEITDEKLPRVLLVRGKDKPNGKRFGPFTSSSSIREALKIIRRIFPFSTHQTDKPLKRPCFDYQIGLCPGTCLPGQGAGLIHKTDYLKNIKNLRMFFEGKKKRMMKELEKEMAQASKKTEYEKAEKIKRQVFALKHIQDVALIREERGPELPRGVRLGRRPGDTPSGDSGRAKRIEGYDISNISGTSAVGAMVVFTNGEPDKDEYRKFKIKTVFKSDDTGMLKEVLIRRFRNSWLKPDLILIDGGRGQVNAAKAVMNKFGLKIPIVGLAKGPKRKRNDLVGLIPKFTDLKTLIKVRDEAHRFAIAYHKKLRSAGFIGAR